MSRCARFRLLAAVSAACASIMTASACASALSNPNPPASPTPGQRVTAPALPAHVLTGYWQDFTNGAKPLRLGDVPSSYNLVAVGFGTATSTPGQVAFSVGGDLSSALGGYTDNDVISDINTLHSRGQAVILSVGGADGTIRVNDAASAASFASSVFSLMRQYGFDGVDVDLENGLSPAYMASALQQLAAKAPGMITTLAPVVPGVQAPGAAYFQLALKIKSILTLVNTQYFNSGPIKGCNGKTYAAGTEDFLTAQACVLLQGGLSPDQVSLSLPASPGAAQSGYVAPSVVNNALDCLAGGTHCGTFRPPTTYPAIRGAADWSVNWDAANGYNFASSVAPHLGTLP
jgi:chitinase